MATNPEELRKHWMAHGLPRQTLDPDPIKQFECWYSQAIDSGIAEPNAMSLATVDANAQPWLRTVLLKLFDEAGFVFFTNYESTKALQIAVNSRVSLLFPFRGSRWDGRSRSAARLKRSRPWNR
jgi:pyridoxamine 5'-phosphate oxidase